MAAPPRRENRDRRKTGGKPSGWPNPGLPLPFDPKTGHPVFLGAAEDRGNMQGTKASLQIKIKDLEREFSLLVSKLTRERNNGSLRPIPAPPEPADRPDFHLGPWLRSVRLNDILALPFIYGMIFPLLILDVSVTSHQAICFRLFGIGRVRKSDYIRLERHQLPYLNLLERFSCDYCCYANGLVAFHDRYALFLKPGESDEFDKKLEALRAAIA